MTDQFKQLTVKGKEIREKELLKFHRVDLLNITNKEKKRRQQVMKRIVNERQRNYNFQHITKHVRKGLKSSLKLLKVVNDAGEIVKIITARKEIEEELIRFNRIHYKKAHEMKVY